jgi:hypothetical protein
MLGELFLGPGFADKVPTRIDADRWSVAEWVCRDRAELVGSDPRRAWQRGGSSARRGLPRSLADRSAVFRVYPPGAELAGAMRIEIEN